MLQLTVTIRKKISSDTKRKITSFQFTQKLNKRIMSSLIPTIRKMVIQSTSAV